MAIISFKENPIIQDSKKVEEIMNALKQPRDRFIQPSLPPNLPKNANAVWFNRCNK